jgi:integrase
MERVPRQFPKALRPEEVEMVAAYAEANCRDGAERSSAWCAPFIRLGAETGMRRNELLHLTWDRIDLEAGHLTVACTDAFTTKSGAERKVPLSQRAREVLTRMQQGRESVTGRVFESGGRPIDPHTCSDTVKRFAMKAGVPRLTPHTLRHTAITRLIERGVPVPLVQRFAGHADIATTMRYCSIADDVYAERIVSALG